MKLICGDSTEELRNLEPCSIDAVVCDPPYGLGSTTPSQVSSCLQAWSRGETWKPKGSGFMGKSWDSWVPPPELWKEVIRVLKPGGHLIAFAGSRTQDLMSISLRLAGFEVRDTIQWLYGTGFPKSHNISKAIEGHITQGTSNPQVFHKLKGHIDKTQKIGISKFGLRSKYRERDDYDKGVKHLTPTTQEAKQYEGYGTALKPAFEPAILCRKPLDGTVAHNVLKHGVGGLNIDGCRIDTDEDLRRTNHTTDMWSSKKKTHTAGSFEGRWPSNVIMDEQVKCGEWKRFFYCAKASRQEREQGLDGHGSRVNIHPTVKPIDLMRYLCRLITPRNGIILDPFLGSGSTGIAAGLEGFDFVGIEREEEYFEIAKTRIEHWTNTTLTYDQPQPKEVKTGEQLSLF